jgi:hypothetical protein
MVGQTRVARGLWVAMLVVAGACASGGGGGSTPATSAASAPLPVSPVADGDIEHTQFSPSLGVDLSKMLRRPTGLYVQDLEVGTGSVAAQGRTAVIRYTGYLPDGKQFDSGEITISIGAGKVIRAWDEGVLGMRVGGRRRLVAPPHLAYGLRGAPPAIPPNAVLVFDMELTQVY